MKVKLDVGAYTPTRAHSTDAGMDLYAIESKHVPAYGSAIFETGVHIKLPEGTAGVLISKSGLNVNFGITSTGLIDEGYNGSITVKLYNNTHKSYYVQRGDKISQLVIVPVLYEQVELVTSLDQDSERGSNGFGSTGK